MCGIIASILLGNPGFKYPEAKSPNGHQKNGSKHKPFTNGNSNHKGTVQKARTVDGNGARYEWFADYVPNERSSNDDKRQILESKLLAGLDNISHRGPDSYGTWISQSNNVGESTIIKVIRDS